MDAFEDIVAVVLAGGAGRRIGGDKAFVPLCGKPLIEHVLDRLKTRFSECWIVSDQKPRFETFSGVRLLTDQTPNLGPLGGIATALESLRGQGIFVVACDMPFLNLQLIEAMLLFAKDKALLTPFASERLHPLHAYYSKEILPHVQAQIDADDLKLQHLPQKCNSAVFPEALLLKQDPQQHSLFNINTPQDLQRAEHLLTK